MEQTEIDKRLADIVNRAHLEMAIGLRDLFAEMVADGDGKRSVRVPPALSARFPCLSRYADPVNPMQRIDPMQPGKLDAYLEAVVPEAQRRLDQLLAELNPEPPA